MINIKNKTGIALMALFLCSLASSFQLEARWTRVFGVIMRTPTGQRVTQKITSLPGMLLKLWHGNAAISGTGSAVVKKNKPEFTPKERKSHDALEKYDFTLNLLMRGASSIFNVPMKKIFLPGLIHFINNGPEQGRKELTELLIEEGRMETQIGLGDCGNLQNVSNQFKNNLENEL